MPKHKKVTINGINTTISKILRDSLEQHLLKLTMDSQQDDYQDLCEHLLYEGCPGIKNMTDEELLKDIMEETPTF